MIFIRATSGATISMGTLLIRTRPFPDLTVARAIAVFLFPLSRTIPLLLECRVFIYIILNVFLFHPTIFMPEPSGFASMSA